MAREVAIDFVSNVRFTEKALLALQYATENYLIRLLADAQIAAAHDGKRIGIRPREIQLVRRLRNERS